MFERKRDISVELKALCDATENRERGSLIEHQEIETLTGFTREHSHWGQLIKKWKKHMLQQKGIKPLSVAGVGYRFPLQDEQLTKQPDSLMKQAIRKVNDAAACIGSISDADLTPDQLLYRAATLSNMTDLKNLNKTHQAKQQSWLANPKALPRIPKQ